MHFSLAVSAQQVGHGNLLECESVVSVTWYTERIHEPPMISILMSFDLSAPASHYLLGEVEHCQRYGGGGELAFPQTKGKFAVAQSL